MVIFSLVIYDVRLGCIDCFDDEMVIYLSVLCDVVSVVCLVIDIGSDIMMVFVCVEVGVVLIEIFDIVL